MNNTYIKIIYADICLACQYLYSFFFFVQTTRLTKCYHLHIDI